MKTILLSSLLLYSLTNTASIAEELEIQLIDESAKSDLFQKGKIAGTIVGCNDNSLKKELACAKKPKDAILSKLPNSKQIKEVNLKDDNEREQIKMQLATILLELNYLKEAQKADRSTIKKLKSVISDLASITQTKKILIQNKGIQDKITEIRPKNANNYSKTQKRKNIKEISRNKDNLVIEVQKNESLSTYAEAYYGDKRKYYRIFKANKHILPASMMLTIGDRLTIPLD